MTGKSKQRKMKSYRKINHNIRLFLPSANKDEIAMQKSAEKRKTNQRKWRNIEERKRTKSQKLQHNHWFCLVLMKRNDEDLTNLRECQISAVRVNKTKWGKKNENQREKDKEKLLRKIK